MVRQGPNNIHIEVWKWKCLGGKGINWLTKLFNEILRSKKMPDEWREYLGPYLQKQGGYTKLCKLQRD